MTDATKARLLLGALVLSLVAAGGAALYQRQQKVVALHQAAVQEGVAQAARQAETQAKADRAAADQVVQAQAQRVADLEAELARRPVPPPAVPVPADAPVAYVVAGLRDLGLHPQLQGEGLALTLPDGRTTLGWGREALRVPPLLARLATLDEFTRAQADQSEAQRQQLAATDRALEAADARAEAHASQAESLQRYIDLTPRERRWAAGLLAGIDPTGTRKAGGFVSYAWGPIHTQVVVLGNTAALGGGFRF